MEETSPIDEAALFALSGEASNASKDWSSNEATKGFLPGDFFAFTFGGDAGALFGTSNFPIARLRRSCLSKAPPHKNKGYAVQLSGSPLEPLVITSC